MVGLIQERDKVVTKAECGRLGGKVKSTKKAMAVRKNGRKGGRPPRVNYVRLADGTLQEMKGRG